MENIGTKRIYAQKPDALLRIIADDQIISHNKFSWNNEGDEQWLTLNEISLQLSQLGFGGVYYVWEDRLLEGTIYQYGNYNPKMWDVYSRETRYKETERLGQHEICDGTVAYQITRIIANEQIIPLEKFKWHKTPVYKNFSEGYLTLDEIAEQLFEMGYNGIFYVWEETPLEGRVYQYGFSGSKNWIQYGETRGFA